MRSRRVLILGQGAEPDVEPIDRAVEAADADAEIRRAGTLAEAVRLASEGAWHADLVVVCQLWSREYSEREVRALLRALPLARIVCCYGPWCESDGRSGSPWPLAARVPVREAAARIRREIDVLDGRCPPLPLTASRDEIFAFDQHTPAGTVHAAEPHTGKRCPTLD
ncbi:MAG TPA: hypothetical protein VML55_07960 [Planctomycetaceae bacterium]|nr:hypothetical protein [Planctomycetaceae bacterium]